MEVPLCQESYWINISAAQPAQSKYMLCLRNDLSDFRSSLSLIVFLLHLIDVLWSEALKGIYWENILITVHSQLRRLNLMGNPRADPAVYVTVKYCVVFQQDYDFTLWWSQPLQDFGLWPHTCKSNGIPISFKYTLCPGLIDKSRHANTLD